MADPTSKSIPGTARFKVGDCIVTVLNDGGFDASFDLVVNVPREDAADAQAKLARRDPPTISLQAFLIEGKGAPILVDTGMGSGRGSSFGHMIDALAALGIAPAEIGTVLLTHLHPDHVGGLVADGEAVFPQAELVVPTAEAAHWLDPSALGRVPEAAKPYFEGAQAAVAPYGSRMRQVADGEAMPGITAVPLPGHTPGHTGYRIDGPRPLLIWGDIVHLPGIQFALPAAGVAFDVDAAQAVETRKRVFATTAADDMLVAGMHLEFPAFGHVRPEGDGYRWIPELWVPSAG